MIRRPPRSTLFPYPPLSRSGDELHVHSPPLPPVAAAIAVARRQHRLEDARELGFSQKEVDEPRARDLDLADQTLWQLERRDQPLGDRPVLLLERIGEREREGRGHVPVRGAARSLELDRGRRQ